MNDQQISSGLEQLEPRLFLSVTTMIGFSLQSLSFNFAASQINLSNTPIATSEVKLDAEIDKSAPEAAATKLTPIATIDLKEFDGNTLVEETNGEPQFEGVSR